MKTVLQKNYLGMSKVRNNKLMALNDNIKWAFCKEEYMYSIGLHLLIHSNLKLLLLFNANSNNLLY